MGVEDRWILTINAGSSSLKFAAYFVGAEQPVAASQIAAIGDNAQLDGASVKAGSHEQAVGVALGWLATNTDLSARPAMVAHRIVHGGELKVPTTITPKVTAQIEAAAKLAPLHNPPALKVIEALANRYPDLPQIACFDTSFHADNPPEATTIPIPKHLRDKGIRRYGFHGLSYASLVRRFRQTTTATLPRRVLALHLGAGASLAAIVDGRGVATTMGFSPMDGLVMATRAGAIDSGVLLHLMRTEGLNSDQLEQLLNRDSGLKALSGGNADMKTLLLSGAAEAEFAVAHYVYWVCRHAGSMIAAMQGLDGIVFTGGIGENAGEIRERILHNLSWAGEVPSWVIQSDEEGELAADAGSLLEPSLSPK